MTIEMTRSRKRNHRFGGNWTEQKLQVLARYLAAYTTALKKQPFELLYIDAFAGTGYRTESQMVGDRESLAFPDLAGPDPQALLEGSAVRALRIDPPFDRYVFIERNRKRVQALETLRSEHANRSIEVLRGDANAELQRLCRETDWRERRGVMFVDPYGMQVEWETICAIAATKAIDLWLLFPLGIGVNRLLTRSGEIPAAWRKRLDRLLGTDDWWNRFYAVEKTRTLFGEEQEHVTKATVESIGRYFNERLKETFAEVAPEPLVLANSANCPLYLFCFAASNERGAPIALKIARHLLEK